MTNHVSEVDISAWLDHQLEAEEARSIGEHLATCRHCAGLRDEMLATGNLFRDMEVLEPSPYLWTRVAAGLDQVEPSVGSRHRTLALFRPAWLRPQILALAATLVFASAIGLMHWNTVHAEREQLAAIDRAYHNLLPQNAESFNPFATSPWNNTDRNPFAIGTTGPAGKTSPASTVKR